MIQLGANLLSSLATSDAEVRHPLVAGQGVRLDWIVSSGQASPGGFCMTSRKPNGSWYWRGEHEFELRAKQATSHSDPAIRCCCLLIAGIACGVDRPGPARSGSLCSSTASLVPHKGARGAAVAGSSGQRGEIERLGRTKPDDMVGVVSNRIPCGQIQGRRNFNAAK